MSACVHMHTRGFRYGATHRLLDCDKARLCSERGEELLAELFKHDERLDEVRLGLVLELYKVDPSEIVATHVYVRFAHALRQLGHLGGPPPRLLGHTLEDFGEGRDVRPQQPSVEWRPLGSKTNAADMHEAHRSYRSAARAVPYTVWTHRSIG